MAALRVTVCLPPTPATDLTAALNEALNPFESMQGHPVERDIWDAWRLDARGLGGFRILPGNEGDPQLIHGQPWPGNPPEPDPPGMCAGGPVRALDLAGPYAETTRRAERDWDVWHDLARDHPSARPFAAIWRDTGSFTDARDLYNGQAMVQEFQRIAEDTRLMFLAGLEHDPVLELHRDRSDFVRRRVAVEARSTDLLTLDGWWIGDGPGGYAHRTHGMSEPTPTPVGWALADGDEAFDVVAYLATLPGETTVVNVHCHT